MERTNLSNSRFAGLKSKKQLFNTSTEVIELDTLIVGNGIASFVNYERLKSEESSAAILLSSDIPLSRILEDWTYSFTYFRGQNVKDFISSKYKTLDGLLFESEPLFYKDQELKPFSGRAKPHSMLDFEDYFKEKPICLDMRKLFSKVDSTFSEENCHTRTIFSIDKNEGLWIIKCGDGVEYRSKSLYWGMGRKRFFDFISDGFKSKLSEQELNFFTSLEEFSILNVTFNLSRAFTESSQTIFIPQSQTHDWGHFILDFHRPENGEQKVVGHIFIYDDELDEEELGKKIRLLRRNADRVFSGFKDSISEEKILLLDQFWCKFDKFDNYNPNQSSSNMPYFISSQSYISKEDFELYPYPFILNLLD